MVATTFFERVRLQYFFDRSDYNVSPGAAVAVTVYLQEIYNPCVRSSLLAPGTDGLIGGGFMIQARSETPSRPAVVRTTAAIAGNPAFDFAIIPQLPVSTIEYSAGLVSLSSNPVFGEVGSRTAGRATVLLPLGTFTFTAGSVPGEVTHLTARTTEMNLRVAGETIVTASGIVLDALVEPGHATITVTAERSEAPPVSAESCLKGSPGHTGQIWWPRNA
jgi:hypothetical protein